VRQQSKRSRADTEDYSQLARAQMNNSTTVS